MRFEDKVALVTGASLGIGHAAAIAFAREGAHVALASRNVERGRAAEQDVRATGGDGHFIRSDVSVEDDVRALVREVVDRWGRLDVLVNNAGVYVQADAVETSLDEWNRVLATNLTGAFLCTRYAVPEMVRTGGGVIINVSSEAGLVGIAGQVAYNVSKGGMLALTQSCAVDFADRGIRVNAVCPGTTVTPLVQEAVNRAPNPEAARRRLEQIRPLDRLGTPDEIASAILYLASDEAAYATGSILTMDGGYTAQ